MPIVRGAGIRRIVHNGVDLVAVRHGASGVLVWTADMLRWDFDGPNDDDLGADWVQSSSGYKIGIVDTFARMAIPDGLVSQALTTDRARTVDQLGQDNYDIEFRIGSKGASDSPILANKHRTQVFARAANAAFTHGVGVDVYSSQLSIVRRVSSTDTIMESGGAYAAGDIVRMRGNANLHSLYCNGEFRCEWDDSGATAQSGSGYRALMIRMDGSKDLLGPRRFSSSLDYLAAA